MEVGREGLQHVTLTIPQGTSLDFDIVHKDEAGHVVDHSGSQARIAFQTYDSSETYDLSSCAACSAAGISVSIPASVTEALPVGSMLWDLIVTTAGGGVIRMCYGTVTVCDTYALDE